MALVSIEVEKYVQKMSRFVIVSGNLGPGSHAEWKAQDKTRVTTITDYKGDEAAVREVMESPGEDKNSRNMKKIDGPWWQTTIAKVEDSGWEDRTPAQ